MVSHSIDEVTFARYYLARDKSESAMAAHPNAQERFSHAPLPSLNSAEAFVVSPIKCYVPVVGL
ncbi:hypothetical protein GCM10023156_60900 [Novipirellula rosea]|uniref:Uncharacterized protein n=1 Tax=Novipirellula rosea TaxID=1031540 RepID=A0ABP8NLR9_9BACT